MPRKVIFILVSRVPDLQEHLHKLNSFYVKKGGNEDPRTIERSYFLKAEFKIQMCLYVVTIHGLNNYTNTKAKCLHLKKELCKVNSVKKICGRCLTV
jgi:hypothetical protein